MNIKALKCLVCNSIIYSRARHDCRFCHCGQAFVDGGFDRYCQRVGAEFPDKVQYVDIEVPVTKDELFQDWNTSTDKYGLILIKEKSNGRRELRIH